MPVQYLFLWRGAEFAGLAGRFCRTHCESLHELIISLSLIGLHLVNKLVRESNDGLHSVTQLTVTKILQESTHLRIRKTEKKKEKYYRCTDRLTIRQFLFGYRQSTHSLSSPEDILIQL